MRQEDHPQTAGRAAEAPEEHRHQKVMPLAIRNRADVFITGEIKYHDYFGHDTDILLAEIGHYESEQYTKEIFYTIIRDLFPHFEVQMTKVNTNPIKYM